MTVPQKIVAARRAIGLTQEELAERAQVTVRTIQRIENGQSIPRMYTLRTIAEVLNIPYSEIDTTQQKVESTQSKIEPRQGIIYTDDDEYYESTPSSFLSTLCLSCFSYLVVPYVHFLVPYYLMRNENQFSQPVLSYGRHIIRIQIWWVVIFNLSLLMTVALNFFLMRYGYFPINYLWIVFIAYIANVVIIIRHFRQIKAITA